MITGIEEVHQKMFGQLLGVGLPIIERAKQAM
jgi:hypothetical protein